MKPFRVLLAIPVLPALGGWFKNRRNRHAHLCAPADVIFNLSDAFHAWVNRLPRGRRSALMRDKEGRHVGSINRLP